MNDKKIEIAGLIGFFTGLIIGAVLTGIFCWMLYL
tara:strand:- start:140 stop:244 length:105 start_codon:yes stop_codon:yes gene_type:complete